MKLIAVHRDQKISFDEDFTFETAYQYILEQDEDPFGNPWLAAFDLILIDDEGKRWLFECDCWSPIEEE